MVALALSQLEFDPADLVLSVLAEHEQMYDVERGLRSIFGAEITVVQLEPTSSQADTVYQTLQRLDYSGPIFIKDADNSFACRPPSPDDNVVCVASLHDFDEINARNKCYVEADHTGQIVNIREKTVISDTFGVGGYHFASSDQFVSSWREVQQLKTSSEIYVSDLIGWLVSHGTSFFVEAVQNYSDWGTLNDWARFLRRNRAIFVALDGLVFERGYEHFLPRFEQVRVNLDVAAMLSDEARRGNSVVYLSIRPESVRQQTERQIKAAGLPNGQLVMGCADAPWTLAGAPHPAIPAGSVEAVEALPGDPHLQDKVQRR
jgi:hypothetical protein